MSELILDVCGGSGEWSKPYSDNGYEVLNLTLPGYDITKWREYKIINVKKSDRDFKTGMETVRACFDLLWCIQENGAPLKFWAVENPMGYLYNFLGYPFFFFQPWEFGETGFLATKKTAIWGYFKKPKVTVRKRPVPGVVSFGRKKNNEKLFYNSKWSSVKADERSKTSAGFAKAFYEANK